MNLKARLARLQQAVRQLDSEQTNAQEVRQELDAHLAGPRNAPGWIDTANRLRLRLNRVALSGRRDDGELQALLRLPDAVLRRMHGLALAESRTPAEESEWQGLRSEWGIAGVP